jgi:hypothetical protein
VHWKKAEIPIEVTVVGIVTFVRNPQDEKALSAIVVTVDGIVMIGLPRQSLQNAQG